jgi:hypothetical protein
LQNPSHIQEGFNPPDIQASYIPVAPGFNPGENEYKKNNIQGFSPTSSLLSATAKTSPNKATGHRIVRFLCSVTSVPEFRLAA